MFEMTLPDPGEGLLEAEVVTWLDGQATHTLYVSAVNRAKIELGIVP